MQEVFCDDCEHKFKIDEKSIKKVWLNKEKGIEEKHFCCPKCKKKYVISITDEEVRNIIEDCIVIDKSVQQLLNRKQGMIPRAKGKSLELELRWKQQN